jgi:acyl carrier protein
LESHLTKDLGLDSLDQVEIIVQLEDAFGNYHTKKKKPNVNSSYLNEFSFL